MISSSVSVIARFAAWSALPDFITRNILQIIHQSVFPLLKLQAPPPRTPAYARNYRATFAVVVLGYLIYNLVEASRGMPANFYEILGVEPSADEGKLKLAFRQFAKKYHPDRVGPEGELLFIEVRDAYEALKSPVRRFAYDRFGPDALGWSNCSSIQDYLRHGLQQSLGFHIASGVFLIAFSFIGKPSPVAFWRYLLYIAQFISEFALILGPSATMSNPSDTSASGSSTIHENILVAFFPRRVAYQHVLLLHQIFIFASIAVSRVAPVLFPPTIEEVEGLGMDPRLVQGVLEKITELSQNIDREITGAMNEELLSIAPSKDVSGQPITGIPPSAFDPTASHLDPLAREMEAIIIETRLAHAASQPGPLQSVFNSAIAKARAVLTVSPPDVARTDSQDMRLATSTQLPPSPISPASSLSSVEDGEKNEDVPRLPSPRPSPPPLGLSRRESYVRQRSVSC